MAQKEPAEGRQFPSAVGPAPERLRGTGISAVLPARLRSRARSRDAGREPCPPFSSSSLPAHTLHTAPGEPAGHPRSIVHGGTQPCPPLRFSGVCAAARPAAHPFSPRQGSRPRHGWPATAPRSPAALRSGARPGLAGGRAAADRQKASVSQPLLNPSSRDGSGQPQRVNVKGFVTAEKREKWGEEVGGR